MGRSILLAPKLCPIKQLIRLQVKRQNIIYVHKSLILPILVKVLLENVSLEETLNVKTFQHFISSGDK